MPPKAKFTRAQLQDAALAIVDSEGLAALSMRSLAAALGTGPMTLYNYVRDRDDLDALVVEAVMAEVRLPRDGADWRRDVRAIVEATWRAVRRHPNVIPLALTRRTLHETTLEWAETLLCALKRGGLAGTELLVAFRTLSGFVMGFAQAQLADPLSPDDGPRADRSRAHLSRVEALPPDRFPGLIEIAGAAAKIGADREFLAGLDIVMAGLAGADRS